MFETHLTVVGRLCSAVDERRMADGTVVANFRVASTERRRDRGGAWVDGDNLYLDVRCKRDLAENTIASLVKGDPVVVTGRLYTRTYEHEGQRRSVVTLEAQSVAADLAWCTAVVTRTRRRSAATSAAPRPVGDDRWESLEAGTAVAPADAGVRAGDAPDLVGAAPGGEGR